MIEVASIIVRVDATSITILIGGIVASGEL
jgi:hypothetical protein